MGEQSFRILCLLLDSPGELVTRDQLRASLWASDTFVDFDHGLNSAVQRLRDCLSDTAEKPRWIETVPRRGYRFVGQVQWQEHEACPEAAPEPLAQTTIGPVGGEASSEFSGQNAPVRPIAPAWRRRVSMIATLALFFLAAGLLAWNTGGVRDRLFPSERASRIHSIAVLPLANLSGDSSQDYFADGMTDELITALAQNHSLRIASRTSAMQFKGVQRPVREIARELGVDGVLEGSVSRTANRVHMTVQLIYAPTDSHVWADSYDRDLNQAVSLPEELSQTVAKEVKSATSADVPRRHINPEAHDAYLRGRYFWFRGSIPETLSFFEKAIQLQPDYAAAWAGLSDTYALRGVFRGGPPKEDLAKAGETARRAVELDDSLAEAHLSMAAWYMWSWNPLQGDAEARKAIDLNPTYAESHYFRHLILLALNRSQEALQEAKRAVELDPFARTYGLGQCYIDLRRFDTAIDELHMQAQLHPADAYLHRVLAEAYWHEGEYSKSQEELEKGLKVSGRSKDAAAVHRAFERGGAKAVAQWQAEIMKTRASKEYVSRFEIASAVALTGDKDETLKHLEASYREHEPALILIETEPAFDFLHSDPRYRTLVRTIGLTPSD
ncbi:MAG TPA: winged helix-turn-helix domain-containing protein [Terriglobales bacterium]